MTNSPRFQLGLVIFGAAVIFGLAIFTRTFQLNFIPTVFSHDEMSYLINAQSVAVSGVGRYGDWQPFSLKPVESYLAELPTLLLAGFFHLPFGLIANARLLPVLMSLTLPFLIASISFSLFKSRRAAWLSWALALFNPWLWQNGRMTFDIPISLWFYVLGMALFLRLKSWQKLTALGPFFIGFYSYQGFKLILPGMCLALSIYILFEKEVGFIEKKARTNLRNKIFQRLNWSKIWPSLITSLFAVGLLSYYLVFQFGTQTASQTRISNQIITPQSDSISMAVNTDRRLALTTPLNGIFLNKYVQTMKEIVGRYLLVFGGKELFFEISASSSPFAVWNHGPLYLIDVLLIYLGLVAIFQHKKYPQLLLLGTLAVIGVLPAVLNQGVWLFFRSSFLFPLLLILAGLGLDWLWNTQRWIFAAVGLLYCAAIVNFGFIYFVRYPVYASENIYFGPRLLAEYLHRLPENQKVVVFEKEPEFVFTNLVFYYQLLNKTSAPNIHQAYKTQTYIFENLTFLPCIPTNFKPDSTTTYVVDSDVPNCPTSTSSNTPTPTTTQIFTIHNSKIQPIFIRSVKDSGVNYTIYNQTLCAHPEKFSQFVNPQSLQLFNLSQLSTNQFCQTWLTQDLPTATK